MAPSKRTMWGNYSDYSGPANLPGSATHVIDPRLQLLATLIPDLFIGKKCLDIGCNAGAVSCQLALDFQASSVTGVDIDSKLVEQANQLFALRASRTRPPTKDAGRVVDYFPMSTVLTHGFRKKPEGEASTGPVATNFSSWPQVKFCAADWVVTSDDESSGSYDVVLAMSVIKWIHLEHLDQGLRNFFHKCATALSPNGYLVIELQNWDSYEKAIRPNAAPHFTDNFHSLKYRPETSFNELLAADGLKQCASSEVLPRRIIIYRKDRSSATMTRD